MLKVSYLFEQGGSAHNGGRPCGWSETWYRAGTIADFKSFRSLFAARRANLLTDNASIIGYRMKEGNGPVEVVRASTRGTITTNSDIPQMSLACQTRTADGKRVKYFRLRGLPDARTTDGIYVPTDAFQTAFTNFARMLQDEVWGWQGLKLTNLPARVNSIDVDGNVSCAAGAAFAVGNYVTFRRCKNAAGVRIEGTYRVLERTSDQAFKIANWTSGIVGANGTVAVVDYELLQANRDYTKFYAVSTQKVGRPFDLYRGRATRR